ncbi:MAG TPA: peptidoglycan-binding domain-containing protein [Chthoniobacterales bacterium]|nr:peptidoglycan-binding domain-containing protein [Chthoniobacterales bacterium]
MRKGIRCFCLLLLLSATVARADEEVRQVQEELRKRNLYFGDINGQPTPDLSNSLKRYQARKGFPATGDIDEVTAASLNVAAPAAASSNRPPLPDTPVLKSDFARQIPEAERIVLEKKADENPDLVPTPPPPAEPPSPAQDISPQKVTELVENYLRDSETDNIPAQTSKYFSYPVKYFDDGPQGAAFVEKDVGYYVRHWPQRKYTLVQPVSFAAAERADETNIQFDIAFELKNKQRHAQGRTRNFWTIQGEGGELKIIAIQEQRLRE